MLKDYFKIIRNARSKDRKKEGGTYYEAHHIVPECLEQFGKNSSTVLLTAKEHYRVHKILAESFKDHELYGSKMLWAFHRMTYSGDIELTEEEYAAARVALMKLWKRKKSEEFKRAMGETMKGNKNGLGNKKNWTPTEEQRKNYSKAAVRRQLGKVGEESRASKGTVVCENLLTGEIVEAGSALQLAKKMNMNCSVFHEELNKSNYSNSPSPKTKRSKYYEFLQTHKIYYKTQ
jgi:hypothetical protein